NNEDRGRRGEDASRRTNTNRPSANDGVNTRVRGTMEGDGSSNRRDRISETPDGEVTIPGRISADGNTAGSPGGNRPGGNPNNGNRTGGTPGGSGNPGGTNLSGNHRGGERGNDRCPDRDRHGNRHGEHHRHTDSCYRTPAYDDTVVYVQSSYPDYDD